MDGGNTIESCQPSNTRGSGSWLHTVDLSCSPTPKQKPARKVALFTFQQHHNVLPRLMCLRQVMCPSCFLSLSQMKNLGITIELDPQGDKMTCAPFGLYSSPAEHSTMGHVVLDLTNLAYQPTTKSCEQPGHPKRHVTFAMSERRPAYPAHAPDMGEDEDEDEGEDDKPHVRPASRKELAEEKRDPDTDDADLLPLSAKKKRTTGMAGPSCYNGTRGSKRLARASRR